MRSLILKSLLFLSLTVLSSAVVSFYNNVHTSYALDGSTFKAGRIMDDAVFYNRNAMNPDQIQALLDSKVTSCDTWGTQPSGRSGYATRADWGRANGYAPPYTCIKNYTQNIPNITNSGSDLCTGSITSGQKSAAQIIHEVSQACGVNPQVLIVKLQKEQGLITDNWPWSKQYEKAMGYGCPDTAPCDPAYAGFFNQVYQTAQAFKRYQKNAANYNYRAGRNNTVYYHPDLSRCGNSSVYIESQATANLYIFTPYQPNQAALNNLYGSGDSCSAYGNRNFWRMFNDWFGSTLGSLIRTEASDVVYYTNGVEKFYVGSMQMAAEFGFGMNDIRFVSQQEVDSLPIGANGYSQYLNYIVKSNSDADADGGSIYLISNGRSIKITSMEMFYTYGFSIDEISYVPLSLIQQKIPTNHTLNSFIQDTNNGVYKVESGQKRSIPELAKFSQLSQGQSVTKLSNFIINRFVYGMPYIDGEAVLSLPNGALKLYESGTTSDITNMGTYSCWRLEQIKKINTATFEYLGPLKNSAKTLDCLASDSSSQTFLIDGDRKFIVPGSWDIARQDTVSDTLIQRIPTIPSPPNQTIYKQDGSISIVENGTRRPIQSMEIFYDLGYLDNNLLMLSDGAYSSIAIGLPKLAIGTPIVDTDGSVYIVTASTKKKKITSITQYLNLGLQKRKLYKATPQINAAYNTDGIFSNTFIVSGALQVADNGFAYSINDLDTENAYGISRSGLASYPSTPAKQLTPRSLTRFIKSSNDTRVYYVENGQKRLVTSWQALQRMNGTNLISTVSQDLLSKLPSGLNIT